MIGTDLLNDLFTNNIDFVAKQMQTIVDALFPNNDDNSESDYGENPLILTGQIFCSVETLRYVNQYGNYEWITLYGDYNVNYSSMSTENSLSFLQWHDNYADNAISAVTNSTERYFNNNASDIALPHKLISSGGFYRIVPPANTNQNFYMAWGQTDIFNRNGSGNIYFDYNRESLADLSTYTLGFLDSTKSFIVTDVDTATNIYNSTVFNDNDYHNSMTVNNIYVGGGAGGIAVGLPVGGLFNYNDFSLALDSLIDDLNVNLSTGNKLPIDHFPTYDEIKYGDMGSFYITPIQQIDSLPTAPDVGDTFPDFSDYLSIVGGAVNLFYNMIDGLGVSLMFVFTFLLCLVINHLKKE